MKVGDAVRLLVYPTGNYEIAEVVKLSCSAPETYKLRNKWGVITGCYRERDLEPLEDKSTFKSEK